MKHLLILLLAWFPVLTLAGPTPIAGSPFDFSANPHFPGPWAVKSGKLVDGEGKEVYAPGIVLTGTACMPQTDSQASSWATKIDRMGVRVVRFMSVDWVTEADKKANMDRLINKLKAHKIPVIVDMYTEAVIAGQGHTGVKQGMYDAVNQPQGVALASAGIVDGWVKQAQSLLMAPSTQKKVDRWAYEPYIVGIVPVNEDVLPGMTNDGYTKTLTYETEVIRKTGYKGLVWGANSGIPNGWTIPGDVEDFHLYWDHPLPSVFWNTSGVKQSWQLYAWKSQKPRVCTEYGSLWPNALRSETESWFGPYMRDQGVQVMISFAYATNREMWSAKKQPIDQYAFHCDPVRISTFRLLVMAMLSKGTSTWANGTYKRTGGLYVDVAGDTRFTGVGTDTRAPFALGSNNGSRLMYRGLDAINTGFQASGTGDPVKFNLVSKGTNPVLEIAAQGDISLWPGRKIKKAYRLDTFTGKNLGSLPVYDLGDEQKIKTMGFWVGWE